MGLLPGMNRYLVPILVQQSKAKSTRPTATGSGHGLSLYHRRDSDDPNRLQLSCQQGTCVFACLPPTLDKASKAFSPLLCVGRLWHVIKVYEFFLVRLLSLSAYGTC